MKVTDLTGTKFGRLIVLERSYPGAKGGGAMWLCKCYCGKETLVRGSGLRSGSSKSCGCLRKELTRNKKRMYSGLASMRLVLRNYKLYAKKHARNFELTEKQFAKITQKDCYYCGAKPNNISKTMHPTGEYIYNGLDRVDNTKGYTVDNVVPCCKNCNMAKNTFTFQEFKIWSERLYKKLFEIKD